MKMEEYKKSDETQQIKIPKLQFLAFRKTSSQYIPESLGNFYKNFRDDYIYNQLSNLVFCGKSIVYDMNDYNINNSYNEYCILDRDITFWFNCPKTGYECSISFTTLHAYDSNPNKAVNKFYINKNITDKDKVYNLHIYNREWISEIYSNIIVVRGNHSIEFYNSLKKRNNTGYITDRYFPDENRVYFADIIKLIKLK